MSTEDLTQTPLAADGSFEVHLAQRGETYRVPADQSILKVLSDAGVDREVRGRERASDHAPTWIVLD